MVVLMMDFLVEKSNGRRGRRSDSLLSLRGEGVPSTTRRRRSVGAASTSLAALLLPNGSLSRDEGSKKRERKNVNLYRNFRLSGQLIEVHC